VLLLDEFDAIAKKRDDDRDVGELKRLVNVLLQALDGWPSTSLLIAATNHSEMLDPAVWRRFDVIMDFNVPSPNTISKILMKEGVSLVVAEEIAQVLNGYSFASVRKILSLAKKSAVLDYKELDASLIEVILHATGSDERITPILRKLKIIELGLKGISQRQIAKQLGISHPTVGRLIKELKTGE